MKKIIFPMLLLTAALILSAAAQPVSAGVEPSPFKSLHVKIDDNDWDNEGQQFMLEISMNRGLANAGEHAGFEILITMDIVSVNGNDWDSVKLKIDDDGWDIDDDSWDRKGKFAPLEPIEIPWDRNGGTMSGLMTVQTSVSLLGPSGNAVGGEGGTTTGSTTVRIDGPDTPPSDTNISDKLRELIITLQQYQESLSGYQDELDKLEMLLEDYNIEDKGILKAISKLRHCFKKQDSKIGGIIEEYRDIYEIIKDIEETVGGIVDAAQAAFQQTLDEAQKLVDELVEIARKTDEDAVDKVEELVQTLIDHGEIPITEPGLKPYSILKEDIKRLRNDTIQFKTELHDPLIQLKLIILLINESDQNEKH